MTPDVGVGASTTVTVDGPPSLPTAVPTVNGPLVTVHFWAAAREAAGCSSTTVTASSCAELTNSLSTFGPQLAKVLAVSSLLVDGARRSSLDQTPLPAGSIVEVLPPFAGG